MKITNDQRAEVIARVTRIQDATISVRTASNLAQKARETLGLFQDCSRICSELEAQAASGVNELTLVTKEGK